MKQSAQAQLPQMRQQGLVVDDLPDEILVYDLDRHKAHCLNHTAALVWRLCDGRTTVSEMARRLSNQLDGPFDQGLVWVALRQLNKLHLLEESILLPPRFAGMSRRQMIRNLGIAAAVTIPLVTSILSPTAQAAGSCFHAGHACNSGTDCCTGICISSACVGG